MNEVAGVDISPVKNNEEGRPTVLGKISSISSKLPSNEEKSSKGSEVLVSPPKATRSSASDNMYSRSFILSSSEYRRGYKLQVDSG